MLPPYCASSGVAVLDALRPDSRYMSKSHNVVVIRIPDLVNEASLTLQCDGALAKNCSKST